MTTRIQLKSFLFSTIKPIFIMSFGFLFLSGCTVLRPVNLPPMQLHQIQLPPNSFSPLCPYQRNQVLMISGLGAAQAYQTKQMAYQIQPNQIEYFAVNQWIDTPLSQWLQLFLEYQIRAHHFQSTVIAPTLSSADVVIQFYVLEALQDFTKQPAEAHFKLLVQLTKNNNKKMILSQIFETTAPLFKQNPQAGVQAMQVASQAMLNKVDCWLKSV